MQITHDQIANVRKDSEVREVLVKVCKSNLVSEIHWFRGISLWTCAPLDTFALFFYRSTPEVTSLGEAASVHSISSSSRQDHSPIFRHSIHKFSTSRSIFDHNYCTCLKGGANNNGL